MVPSPFGRLSTTSKLLLCGPSSLSPQVIFIYEYFYRSNLPTDVTVGFGPFSVTPSSSSLALTKRYESNMSILWANARYCSLISRVWHSSLSFHLRACKLEDEESAPGNFQIAAHPSSWIFAWEILVLGDAMYLL